MQTNWLSKAVGAAALLAIGGAEVEAADETPWGEAVDGMACRIIVNSNYCVGEKIFPAIEFKNVSASEKQKLFNLQSYYCYLQAVDLSKVELIGPGGPMAQNGRASGGSGGNFLTLAPGETRRFESDQPYYGDIRNLFHFCGPDRRPAAASFGPGEYKLTYTYLGPKISGNATGDQPNPAAWKLVSNTAKFSITAPSQKDLSVHEWGVFSVYPDAKFANESLKAEWDSLPKTFYRQFPTRRLLWQPAGVRKPIIYFYTPRTNLELEAQVSFTEGAPVVWWPACTEPKDFCNQMVGCSMKPMPPPTNSIKNLPLFRTLKWQVVLGESLPGQRAANNVSESSLPADCWLQTARAVKDAARLTTHEETERFIYYDGVIPAPNYLCCTEATPASIKLKNNAAFSLKSLFVIDRRATGKNGPVRFAVIDEVAAGAEVSPDFRDLPSGDCPATGETAVEAALRKAGLSAAEAHSVVEIWRPGFFMEKGVTAFYILPQAEYDRLLPLKITPQPGEIRRVGIVLHPFVDGEPELRKKARELVAQLGAPDIASRDAGAKALIELGGIALCVLREAAEKDPNVDVRTRCSKILEETDASLYLKMKETKPGYWD